MVLSDRYEASRRRRRLASVAASATLAAGLAAAQGGIIGTFPDVAAPSGNPPSAAKALLGKALFFEEQLSSDNTMACATCHFPEAGGADVHAGASAPGLDGILGSPDDVFGSPGVVLQSSSSNYEQHPVFGVGRQATGRSAPTVIGAAFFRSLFWDLRAEPVFTEEDGTVVLTENAALESQAVEPPVSSVEMAHQGIGWDEIVPKLGAVVPLRLATHVPAELAAFLAGQQTYGPLFALAFGDAGVTRERVAMAIATYERTLVPDQTPFQTGTMTAQQQSGFTVYLTKGACSACHGSSGVFSDGFAHTIFLPEHVEAVKAPTLLNAGLRKGFMHSGQLEDLDQVLTHYQSVGFLSSLSAAERLALLAFLGNALTDPRVVAKEPPFDRPTLRSELAPPGSNHYGLGTPGTGGFVPEMIAISPPYLGNLDFKLGVGNGLGGAVALLAASLAPSAPGTKVFGVPIHVDLAQAHFGAKVLSGGAAGEGVATIKAPLPGDAALAGVELFVQWAILDPNAIGGFASSVGAVLVIEAAGI